MTLVLYLDEFGHIGPYICKNHHRYNDSPVFGLAGFALPISHTREFSTWFYKLKCRLLEFEIDRSGKHPSVWEKKGSSLYTPRNVEKYAELRKSTNRIINKIKSLNGFVTYVGSNKSRDPLTHNPKLLFQLTLRELIKRADQHCQKRNQNFVIIMDEHQERSDLVTTASISMFGVNERRLSLLEPPFQVESHRYQTVQCADWIAGIVGRLGALWHDEDNYAENIVIQRYFQRRLNEISIFSGIRD